MELSEENKLWLNWINSKRKNGLHLTITISSQNIYVKLLKRGSSLTYAQRNEFSSDNQIFIGVHKNDLNKAIDICKNKFAVSNIYETVFK